MFRPDDFEVQIQQENPPGIHAEPSIPPAQDEEYGDFIVKHGQNMGGKFLPVNELFGILYIPLNEIGPLEINSYTYASLPKCYTFMDADALNSSGITRLHNHPYLKLQGEGTVIAVIDSGIDYLNPIFRNGDVSRIAYIKILSEKILPVSATGTGISGRRHYAGDFFCSEDGTRDGNAGFRLSGTWHQSERTCW